MQGTQVWSLGQEDPQEKEMAAHSSMLVWKSHRQELRGADSPLGHKGSDMQLCFIDNYPDISDFNQFLLNRHPTFLPTAIIIHDKQLMYLTVALQFLPL